MATIVAESKLSGCPTPTSASSEPASPGYDEFSTGDGSSQISEADASDSDDQVCPRSKKTQKRKRRATSPSTFGAILSQALEVSERSTALGPSTALAQASRSALRLAKEQAALDAARKKTAAARHERQERGHVKDVIGGWTPRPAVPFSEWLVQNSQHQRQEGLLTGGVSQEKVLRRLAQTGVVKLFNAIKAAQKACENGVDEAVPVSLSGAQKRKLKKLTGEHATSAKTVRTAAKAAAEDQEQSEDTAVKRSKPNVLGSRGKQEALANLSKASFLELIKSGGTQSKI